MITAMVTPMREDGSVDYEQAGRLANALLDSGSDGILVSGTTGESPTLSAEEKLRLITEVKSAIGARGAVMAGTSSYNTAESVALSRKAEQRGADALLLVSGYYNRPGQEGLYRHFKAIAEAVSIPCMLYNVPSRTVVNLEPETVIRLAEIDNIVGVKEASGNLGQIARIIEGTPDDFRVWSGNDGDTFLVLCLGGYGVVSVASHLVGQQIKAMMRLFLMGQVTAAADMHRRLLPLFQIMFVATNPQPIKWALDHVGFRVGNPRLPLLGLGEFDEVAAAKVQDVLAGYGINLPVSAATR